MSFLATVVEGAVDRAVRKLNLVLAAAPPQEAVALVQGCVISTLDYTRRTVHEVVAEHLWKRFDDAVVEGLERAMGGSGWQATPKVKQQLFLPGSMGGFSFRQFEGTAEAAILASYAAAFRHWGSSILEPVNFDLQVKNYNDQRVRRADRVEVGYTALMRRLTEIKKPQKLLSGLVRKLREEEFLLGLSKEQRVQIGAMKDPGAALYLTSVDWGTVLELQPGQRPYFSAEVFKYLFRRALVALKNPHGLDPALVSTCGRFFVTSGGTCSESMDLRLSHAESKCLGVRGQKKHTALQGALSVLARELHLAAGIKGDILGTALRGDVTIAGHQPRSVVVDVKNFNPETLDVEGEKDRVARDNAGHYKTLCAAAGMDFISFVTTVWGGFGLEAELFMKMLAERLAEREDISFSRARMTIRRRLQASFLNQIALNGLVYMKRIWARMVAMSC